MDQVPFDAVVPLQNRATIENWITLSMRYAKRHKSKFAIVFFHLNRLKNDKAPLGQNIEELLKQSIARRLEKCVRKTDSLTNWKKDEFVLVLPIIEHPDEISPILERCQEITAQTFVIEKKEIVIASSVGVSIFPTDGKDVNTLLQNANAALYDAKAKGPNCISFYNASMVAQITPSQSLLEAEPLPTQEKPNNVIPLRPNK
jgi:diguanylate cyclase (GGDEF)-like protein